MKGNSSLDTSELRNVAKVVYVEDHKREISCFLLSCKDSADFFRGNLSIARAYQLPELLVASKHDK